MATPPRANLSREEPDAGILHVRVCLIDMAHNRCAQVHPRAKPAIGFADIVEEGDTGEPGAGGLTELGQPNRVSEAEVNRRLRQQRLCDRGDISGVVDQTMPTANFVLRTFGKLRPQR
jgi:hypothetical protein